jgi:hypothetical protein
MNVSTTAKAEAALEYIAMGFPVIPLCWPTQDGPCGCGRGHEGKSIGKVPLTEHGLNDATQTQAGVNEYWQKWPDANVAIVIPEGYFVLDVDAEKGGHESLDIIQEQHAKLPATMSVITGGGGLHLWFKADGIHNTTALAGFSGLDVRGVGGYVVAPPSIHRSGNEYAWVDRRPIAVAPDWLITLCTNKQQPSSNSYKVGQAELIPEGQRNQTLASKAGTMRRAGFSSEAIFEALANLNRESCQPPLPDEEVRNIANSVGRYPPANGSPNGNNTYLYKYIERNIQDLDTERNKNATEIATETGKTQQEPLSKRVEDWVNNSGSRWCETPELDRDLGLTSIADKNNRREILVRLEEKGIIEKHPKIQKQFRFVNKLLTPIKFKTATSAGILPFKWPLKIEEYVNLFPGNLVVIAGATNAGKTALLLNTVYLNQFTFPMPIYYFCSEMGDVELKERLEQFPGMSIEEWNFRPFDRSTDFADVIAPDCVNIVDYLEITEDLYSINTHLTAITRKLGNGLAIVAIQKKVGQKWGRGQEFSAEKSKLYLSMDERKLTIVKGKSWTNKKTDPNGLRVEFNIVRGCEFEMTKEWYRPND